MMEAALETDSDDRHILLLRSPVMRISYDKEVDALYIRFVEGKHECRTLRLNDEISLNIGANEILVGIEILDAREVVGKGKLPKIVLENIAAATAS
jgi:uncharacterized protein YuzE